MSAATDSTAAAPSADDAFPLDTRPLSDPEAIADRDRQWLEKVYARGEAQLTVRAAVTGMILGGLLGIPPTPVFAGGGLCGMLAAFVVAVTSGLVARALFREPTGE